MDYQVRAPENVKHLCFENMNWNFMFHMKKNRVARRFERFDNLPEKIWWIKANIRVKTFVSQKCIEDRNKPALPPGVSRIIPDISKELLSQARDEIKQLFEKERLLPEDERLPHAYYANRGLYYLFGSVVGSAEKFVAYTDGITFLKRRGFHQLVKFCDEYAGILRRAANIPLDLFEKNSMLLLLQYEPKYGLWLHVDNVARTDGLITTISLGPPDVNADFVPLLHPSPERQPVRINLNEGDMLVMQGESRWEWAHGIPYGLPTEKYTVMIKLNNLPGLSKQVGYSRLLDIPMCSFDLQEP